MSNRLACKALLVPKFSPVRQIAVPAPKPVWNDKPKFTQKLTDIHKQRMHNSKSGKTFGTHNPSTKEKIADVQEEDKADVDLAVKAASDAFRLGSEWRRMDAAARGYLLNKLAVLIESREMPWNWPASRHWTMGIGKPYKVAYLADVPSSVAVYRYYVNLSNKQL